MSRAGDPHADTVTDLVPDFMVTSLTGSLET